MSDFLERHRKDHVQEQGKHCEGGIGRVLIGFLRHGDPLSLGVEADIKDLDLNGEQEDLALNIRKKRDVVRDVSFDRNQTHHTLEMSSCQGGVCVEQGFPVYLNYIFCSM